jgi:hypothetical protein
VKSEVYCDTMQVAAELVMDEGRIIKEACATVLETME